MPRYTGKLDQIRQLGCESTGSLVPQIVKAQIEQEVLLGRDSLSLAITQVFQPGSLQASHKGFLEGIRGSRKNSAAE
ncbi:hypothetical protein D3C76_1758120 [compost metagenome]